LFGGSSGRASRLGRLGAERGALAPSPPLCWFWTPEGDVHDVALAELLAHQPAIRGRLPALAPGDLADAGTGARHAARRRFRCSSSPFTAARAKTARAADDGAARYRLPGSGSAASAAAFDKGRAKEMVRGRLRVAECARGARSAPSWLGVAREMLERHERVVLKPVAGGSSRGLFFVRRGDAIPEAACRTSSNSSWPAAS